MGKIKRADLDLIRCFAIIFVISVHGLSYVGFYELSNPSITLFVCHLIRVIVIICVPLFLILTGYLSAEKEYILSFKYLEKPFRLLAIYIVCALICSIPQFMRGEIKSFFVALFEFKAAPYAWYLAMYLGLYLMIPFLNEFIASKNGGGGKVSLFCYFWLHYLRLRIIVILILLNGGMEVRNSRHSCFRITGMSYIL